ncbi:MAG: hypothetical protein ACI9JT_002562, partial [Polaribacter sp.]
MKKTILLSIFLLGSHFLSAQCPLQTDNGTQFDSSSLAVGNRVQVANIWGGQYMTINNVVAGQTYTFDNCGTPYDSEITIFDPSNSAVAFSTDDCGDDGQITGFVAPVSGSYKFQINGRGCSSVSDFSELYLTLTSAPVSCTDPDVPSITATPNAICPSGSTTLNWTGSLNDATAWHVYTTSCGVGQLGPAQSGTSLVVTPTVTTTYYIRGEGGCVTPGSCGQVTVTVNSLDDASFNYGAAAHCADAVDPIPTITGLAGGTFSSTAGLSINAATGAVDVSASTPSTYTVTYTTAGSCPNSSSVSVTVNALDDASFTYDAAAYCIDDSDPTPTITGLAGGTFSST